jgi:uncharacterized membrane protein YoaK (UPF0700 family)
MSFQTPPQPDHDRAGNFIVFFPMGALIGAILHDFGLPMLIVPLVAFIVASLLVSIDHAIIWVLERIE